MGLHNFKIDREMNKYGAKKTMYDGFLYASIKEAGYAAKLDQLKKAKKADERVMGFRKQVPFPITVNNQKICTYILDFLITYSDGRIEHVDVKGYKKGQAYAMFRIKKKLIMAVFGIDIIER